jgi:hypothetical protein
MKAYRLSHQAFALSVILLFYGRINNHPYFKGENQNSNYNNNWQPYTQVQYMVSIHTCIVSGAGRWASTKSRAASRSAAVLLLALPGRSRQSSAAP